MSTIFNYTTAFDTGAAHIKGAEEVWLRCVASDGSENSGDTWFEWALVTKSNVAYAEPSEKIRGESGRVLNTEAGDVEATVKFTFAQSDANLLNFMWYDLKGKYFALLRKIGTADNNTHTWLYAPLCTIDPGFSFDGSARNNIEAGMVNFLSAPAAWDGTSLTAGACSSDSHFLAVQGTLSASISGAQYTYGCFRDA